VQIPEPDIDGHKVGVCDVHSLVDGDDRERVVTFCAICDAWMCEPCKDNILKRALAWEKRVERKLLSAIK
jgi:hypothetical protein